MIGTGAGTTTTTTNVNVVKKNSARINTNRKNQTTVNQNKAKSESHYTDQNPSSRNQDLLKQLLKEFGLTEYLRVIFLIIHY